MDWLGAVADPDRFTLTFDELLAFELIVRTPVWLPSEDGLYVTGTLRVPLALMVRGAEMPTLNGPLVLNELIFKSAFPVFVMVMLFCPESPASTVSNLRVDGLTEICGFASLLVVNDTVFP